MVIATKHVFDHIFYLLGFQKSDLLSNNRRLLYEGMIKWMSARGKPAGQLQLHYQSSHKLTCGTQNSDYYMQYLNISGKSVFLWAVAEASRAHFLHQLWLLEGLVWDSLYNGLIMLSLPHPHINIHASCVLVLQKYSPSFCRTSSSSWLKTIRNTRSSHRTTR